MRSMIEITEIAAKRKGGFVALDNYNWTLMPD